MPGAATAACLRGTWHCDAEGKPELAGLPAGDRTCLIAAVENGADAVYFGLQRHNARMRANNFDGTDLPEVMALLHRRGASGYDNAQHAGFSRRVVRSRSHCPRSGSGRRRRGHCAGPGTGPVDPRDRARSRDPRVDSDVDHQRGRGRARSRARLHAGHPGTRAPLAEIGRIRSGDRLSRSKVFVHGAPLLRHRPIQEQCLTSEDARRAFGEPGVSARRLAACRMRLFATTGW